MKRIKASLLHSGKAIQVSTIRNNPEFSSCSLGDCIQWKDNVWHKVLKAFDNGPFIHIILQ